MSAVATTHVSEAEVKQISAQLSRILESTYFHGSQRCSRFLQYPVDNVLAGCDPKELKERIIGIEVFNRDSDYDTAQDSTVRVTANEVRKRLAQYYNAAATDEPVIDLPTGSYAVVFRWKSGQNPTTGPAHQQTDWHPGASAASALPISAPEAEEQAHTTGPAQIVAFSPRRMVWLLGFSILLLVVTTAFGYRIMHRSSDAGNAVWAPLLNSQKDITICIAEPVVYRPWSEQNHLTGPEDYMVSLPDSVIGLGDAYALTEISGLLGSRRKTWNLLPSGNTSFRDLTRGPVILIGSFSNPWANRLLGSLRYVFVGGNKLVDRTKPAAGWTVHVSPRWEASEDYAVISKLKSPDTGEIILALGGATNFGTEAAGEFLTNPEMLAAAMKNAPSGWQSKNFQLVLHVKVQGGAPEQPEVVARYFW